MPNITSTSTETITCSDWEMRVQGLQDELRRRLATSSTAMAATAHHHILHIDTSSELHTMTVRPGWYDTMRLAQEQHALRTLVQRMNGVTPAYTLSNARYLAGFTADGHAIAVVWPQTLTPALLDAILDETDGVNAVLPVHIYAKQTTAPIADDWYRFHQVADPWHPELLLGAHAMPITAETVNDVLQAQLLYEDYLTTRGQRPVSVEEAMAWKRCVLVEQYGETADLHNDRLHAAERGWPYHERLVISDVVQPHTAHAIALQQAMLARSRHHAPLVAIDASDVHTGEWFVRYCTLMHS